MGVVLSALLGGASAGIAAFFGAPIIVTLAVAAAGATVGSLLGGATFNALRDLISEFLISTPDPLVKTTRYIWVDPLVLDLDGDGLETTPLSQGIQFDTNGDTIKTATAWIGADDGLLVLDRNGNGVIDSGRELFGDETLLANGQKAPHGFAALAELDSVADGIFDSKDAQFGAVRIWRDLNQDGISQANELQTLAQAGVTSIKIASTATNTKYGDAQLVQSGTFARTDGSEGQAGSFILAVNNAVTTHAPIEVSEPAKALPNIQGSAWVRGLQQAATLAPELIALYDQAKAADTRAEYVDGIGQLLRAWANQSGYANASQQALQAGKGLILRNPVDDQERGWLDMAVKADDTARNAFRATLSAQDQQKFDDMRESMVGDLERLYAYEAFTGHTFLNWSRVQIDGGSVVLEMSVRPPGGRPVQVSVPLSEVIRDNRIAMPSSEQGYIVVTVPTPVGGGMPHLQMLWERLVDDASSNLMPGMWLEKYLDMVQLSVTDAGVALDFGQMDAALDAASAADAHEGAALFLDIYKAYGDTFKQAGWNGFDRLQTLVQSAATDTAVRNAFTATGYSLFTAGATQGTAQDDILAGGEGANTFRAGAGNDLLHGQGGNDGLWGDAGDDLLFGGAGNDTLQGGDGHDVLNGGAGNDILAGGVYDTWNGRFTGYGNDTYLFGRGDGQDTIYDSDTTVGNVDKLVFKAGVLPADIQLVRSNEYLILKIVGTSDQVTINGYFSSDATSGWMVEEIRFTDAPETVWSVDAVKLLALSGGEGNDNLTGYATNDTLVGNGGNDTLYARAGNDVVDGGLGNDNLYGEAGTDMLLGGDGADTLQGGAGDDVLDGGAGNDILAGGIYDTWNGSFTGYGNDAYLFGRGDGQDIIYDSDTTAGNVDKLVFKAGVLPSNIQLVRSNEHLILKIIGTSDQVTINGYFVSDAASGWIVEEICFTDAPEAVWRVDDIKLMALSGGEGNETLTGYATDDTLAGNGGSDTLYGRGGDDVLDGGAGNDNLQGEAGADTLLGGDGADTLQGGAGDDVLDGGAGNDILAGGIYDTWNGRFTGYGNDTYLFGRGDGQDTIYDSDTTAGNVDRLVFKSGVQPTDIQLVRSNEQLILKITGTSDQVTINGYFASDATSGWIVEEICFTDAPETVWRVADVQQAILSGGEGNDTLTGYATDDTLAGNGGSDTLYGRGGDDVLDGGAGNDNLQGEAGADTLLGGDGADTLQGGAGDDVLDGGAGNDILAGGIYDTWNGRFTGYGNDTYLFGRGDGQDTIYDSDTTAGNVDRLVFKSGVQPTDIQLVRSGDNLVLKIIGTTDQVTINGYFTSDATSGWVIEEILFTDAPETVWDVAAVKPLMLTGGNGNDTLTGYESSETIVGNGGNDVLYGRGGDDVLEGGVGNDNLQGDAGADTLLGGEGADTLQGGAGDDLLNGGDGADMLQGGAGNDVLEGGAGNDILAGGIYDTWNGYYWGYGNDTYLFGRGAGQDTIIDNDSTTGNTDTLSVGEGVNFDQLWFRRVGSALEVSIIGTSDKSTVSNWYSGSAYQLEQFKTADGKVLLNSQVDALVSAMAAFAPPPAGQTTLAANYQTALNPVLAANWN